MIIIPTRSKNSGNLDSPRQQRRKTDEQEGTQWLTEVSTNLSQNFQRTQSQYRCDFACFNFECFRETYH